jgi:hypothetical protein
MATYANEVKGEGQRLEVKGQRLEVKGKINSQGPEVRRFHL